MRRLAAIIACASLVAIVPATVAAGPVTIVYGSQTLSLASATSGHFTEVFNLLSGDITLSYTIDMTGVLDSATPWDNWAEVGIRQVGSGDFNPGPFNTYQGGAGGWVVSNAQSVLEDDALLNDNDQHALQASGGRGWADYDATGPETVVAPFGTTANHGMWFDRDGVDQIQAALWGMSAGGVYDTRGIYNIVITYHAIDAGLGTMFATINGVQQGFYTAGYKNAQPEIFPAGLSFTGDMSQMQVFYGIVGAADGGNVQVSNLTVTGYVPDGGMTLTLLGCALVGLGVLRRRFRS